MVGILCSKNSFPPFFLTRRTLLPATYSNSNLTGFNPISREQCDVNSTGIKTFRAQNRRRRLLKTGSSSSGATPTSNNEPAKASMVTAPANPKSESQGSSASSSAVAALDSGAEVVRKFYWGINARDVASVEQLIAEDCVYEDLVFPQPFVGRTAILEFFQKFIDSISKDLQFVIDDISDEDSSAVGVTWHLEWNGKPFPFSKGCSFYRLKIFSGRRKIIYGRDIVEPAMKPGDFALVAIRGVTWLLQRFPKLVDQF